MSRAPTARVAILVCLILCSCARMAPPPGGPEDRAPPHLLGTVPESVGVYPDWNHDVEFRFDEVVSEGGTPSLGLGTGDLEHLILLSPSHEIPKIKWKRDRITVAPREGWKPNRVYRIEMLPGIIDLRRNRSDTALVITLSTGAPEPTDTLEGQAVDWVAGQTARAALIGLALLPDTLIYRALTDSSGKFRIGPLPHGTYVAFAVLDNNHNLQREEREPFDSTTVAAGTTRVPTLWIFPHDTVGPRITTVTATDSLSATITFSQPLDPYQRFDSLTVALRELPDSTPVRIHSLLPKAADDSIQKSVRVAQDSLRDTTKAAPPAPGDTVVKKPGRPAAPPVPPRRLREVPDTTADKAILSQRPALFDKLVIRPDSAFKAGGKYVVEVFGVRNVNRVAGDARGGLSVPESKPVEAPSDSTRSAGDSTRVPVDSAAVPAPRRTKADSLRAKP